MPASNVIPLRPTMASVQADAQRILDEYRRRALEAKRTMIAEAIVELGEALEQLDAELEALALFD